ncbi:MAG: molecular chaperone HtpG, partial [Raoultibacter sp.]
MERVLSSTPGSDELKSERVLELNADHPIFSALKTAQESGDDEKVKLYTDILYNQALLVEGMPVDDPIAYAQAVCKLMA